MLNKTSSYQPSNSYNFSQSCRKYLDKTAGVIRAHAVVCFTRYSILEGTLAIAALAIASIAGLVL